MAEVRGGTPDDPGPAHPRHSGHAPGHLFFGPPFGYYFLSSGSSGAPGIYLGRRGPRVAQDFPCFPQPLMKERPTSAERITSHDSSHNPVPWGKVRGVVGAG